MFSRLFVLGTLCVSFGFVGAAATSSTTTLQSSINPSIFGRAVTLTATVSPSFTTGKVTFYDGVTPIGIASLANGKAAFTTRFLPSGARSLKALYIGDAQDQASTSSVLSQTVMTLPQNGFQAPANVTGANLADARSQLAVGDLNGDGIADLIAADFQIGQVSVLFGNGDGTFKPGASYATDAAPVSVVVADFDGDGHSDLAVSNGATSADDVSILLNNGNGTFKNAVNYKVGPNPNKLITADFNGDGFADLVNTNFDGTVSVLLGKGDGTFQTSITTKVAPGGFSLAVADVNGDGRPDLVVVLTSSVAVFLGAGNGHFDSSATYPVTAGAGGVVAGDLNGDGRLDLAVVNQGDNSVSILLANANGTFQPAVKYGVPNGPASIAIGDFNGDGYPDLVTTEGGVNSVGILLGKGDGTLRAPVSYSTGAGSSPQFATVADFNGDGVSDLAIADFFVGYSTVLLGVAVPQPQITGTARLVSAPDGNVGVGDPLVYELDVSNTGTATATNLALSNSNPTGGIVFDPPSFGNCTSAASGFDCTGLADLGPNSERAYTITATAAGAGVVTNAAIFRYNNPPQAVVVKPVTITVQPAAGQPAFTAVSQTWRPSFTPNSAVVTPDGVIATDSPFPVNLSLPSGAFSISPQDAHATALALPATFYASSTLLADLDGNGGANDLVILDSPQSTAFVVLNVTGGSAPSFTSIVPFTGFASAGLQPTSAAAFRDPATGFTDLAIFDAPTDPSLRGEIVFAVNDGAGNFGNFVRYDASAVAGNLIGVDLNNDGMQDLAFLDPASNSIGVMLSSASQFSPPLVTSLGDATAIAMAAGNFNGDGFTDLVVLTPAGVNIFLGIGDGTFSAGATLAIPDPGSIAGLQPGMIVVADFNGDGNQDIAVASPASNLVTIFPGDGQGNFGTPAPYVAANPIALAAGTLTGASNPSLAVINGPAGSTPGSVSILTSR
jgi:uncharacterized repeat protein (TIGR01451 family)